VARVELDSAVHVDHYEAAPHLGPTALEIQFIEVSSRFRRSGIGTEVVRELAARNPGRRLVAFSEADEFWASLGWYRYDHPEGPS
jgi:ribosomal protein S18 acetylase RimI-like enzyme